MPSRVSDVILSEPSGRNHAVVMFSGALFFSSLYVYNVTTGNSSAASWLLFMIVGSTLSGVAESLPKERRRTAGLLRVTAVFVPLCLIFLIIFAPELIVGER